MKKHEWAIVVATLYLVIYVALFNVGAPLQLLAAIFVLSPLPVFYMVYQILTDPYQVKLLPEGEEFGYANRDKPTTIM